MVARDRATEVENESTTSTARCSSASALSPDAGRK